jgi:hypothetical protein
MIRAHKIKPIVMMLTISSILVMMGCAPSATPMPTPAHSSIQTLASTSEAGPAPRPTTTPASGIRFTVTRGPTCPGPARPGQVCTAPYEGTFVVVRHNGTEATRFTTGKDGRFTVDLPPGDYTITLNLDTPSPFPRGESVNVIVTADAYADVSMGLDTGIR